MNDPTPDNDTYRARIGRAWERLRAIEDSQGLTGEESELFHWLLDAFGGLQNRLETLTGRDDPHVALDALRGRLQGAESAPGRPAYLYRTLECPLNFMTDPPDDGPGWKVVDEKLELRTEVTGVRRGSLNVVWRRPLTAGERDAAPVKRSRRETKGA
jgi:hypothetical protein